MSGPARRATLSRGEGTEVLRADVGDLTRGEHSRVQQQTTESTEDTEDNTKEEEQLLDLVVAVLCVLRGLFMQWQFSVPSVVCHRALNAAGPAKKVSRGPDSPRESVVRVSCSAY